MSGPREGGKPGLYWGTNQQQGVLGALYPLGRSKHVYCLLLVYSNHFVANGNTASQRHDSQLIHTGSAG